MPISAKPDSFRDARRWFTPDVPPVARRGREHLIVRWIGAGNRRPPRPAEDAAEAPAGAVIIHLSWADTFGRPQRRAAPGSHGLGQAVTLLPFRRPRASGSADGGTGGGPSAPRRTGAQPSVPVLR